MLCEKCGRNNDVNAVKCSYCGSQMPQKTSFNGFGDILNYDSLGSEQKAVASVKNETEKAMNNSSKRNSTGIIALVISVLTIALVLASMMLDGTSEKLLKVEAELSEREKEIESLTDDIENLEKETAYLQETLDTLLQSIYEYLPESNIVVNDSHTDSNTVNE